MSRTKKGRALIVARAIDRLNRQPIAFVEIVSVAMRGLHPVRLCKVRQWTVRLALVDARVNGIQIVLAKEDDRELVQRCKVCALVKDAFFHRRIAEESDGHFPVAHALVGKRAADGNRNRA